MYHFASGNECYRGRNCPFAHGSKELIPKETRPKRSISNTSVSRYEVIYTDKVRTADNTVVVIDADLMATDDANY